jgi:aspartyl-tRNA(Asn)/glutamyl-tRNA(Gln) amidotransferase subunit A
VTVALTDLTIAELGPKLASRELSPVEVTDAFLRRIEQYDGQIHAYVRVTVDRARADARLAEAEIARGNLRGPLHGVPVALKDLFDTAGIPTTGCSRAFLDRVPAEDGLVVSKLREAGAVLLGKLAMHELATGAADRDGPFPPARNPWDLDRMPGGSSSGSGAAVAARLCAGALGTDTGGSIRGPASWCGIVGHKPTYGLVSRRGVMPLSWTLDHVGPMARTVEDSAILLQAIAGHDPLDDGSANVPIPDYRSALSDLPSNLRLGVPWEYLDGRADLDDEMRAIFRSAVHRLGALGARIEPIEIPDLEHADTIGTSILVAEAYTVHEAGFRARLELYGRPFRDRVLRGALWSAADYIQATRARGRFRRSVATLMTEIDLIAMPTSSTPAELFDDPDVVPYRHPSFTRPFNVTGQPSISVPCGYSASGLPVGLMLSGRPFEDRLVLQVAHAYERSRRWRERRPRLSGATEAAEA